jgi:hypothetical protein
VADTRVHEVDGIGGEAVAAPVLGAGTRANSNDSAAPEDVRPVRARVSSTPSFCFKIEVLMHGNADYPIILDDVEHHRESKGSAQSPGLLSSPNEASTDRGLEARSASTITSTLTPLGGKTTTSTMTKGSSHCPTPIGLLHEVSAPSNLRVTTGTALDNSPVGDDDSSDDDLFEQLLVDQGEFRGPYAT